MNDKTYPIFYRKVVKGAVSGLCLTKRGDLDEYILKGDPNNSETDIDDITLEIFDEEGEKFFMKKNKGAIKNGYLMQLETHNVEIDETNAVSDGFLKDLLKQPYPKMKKSVGEFTSSTPIRRLLVLAEEDNKAIKTVTFIRKAAENLEEKERGDITGVTSVDDGTTSVKTI